MKFLQRIFEHVRIENKKHKDEYERLYKTGRNEACVCGSGKKFKQCCIHKKRNFKPRRLFPKLFWSEIIN